MLFLEEPKVKSLKCRFLWLLRISEARLCSDSVSVFIFLSWRFSFPIAGVSTFECSLDCQLLWKRLVFLKSRCASTRLLPCLYLLQLRFVRWFLLSDALMRLDVAQLTLPVLRYFSITLMNDNSLLSFIFRHSSLLRSYLLLLFGSWV